MCVLLKKCQAKTITDAWELLHMKLTKHGHKTKNFILDNDCSNDMKPTLTKNNESYQLMPPNMHCRNAAEHAIHTFKITVWQVLPPVTQNFPYQNGTDC